MSKGKKGYYTVKNPKKLIHEAKNCKLGYRSTWEARFMLYLESQPLVKKWGYECIEIQYLSSLDGKIHRYYPDFYAEIGDNTFIVEIKPYKESVLPTTVKNPNNKNYKYNLLMYLKNKDKWEAAKKFCASKGWQFKVITERELGI